jgi:hypothetical protein
MKFGAGLPKDVIDLPALFEHWAHTLLRFLLLVNAALCPRFM